MLCISDIQSETSIPDSIQKSYTECTVSSETPKFKGK